MNSDLQPSVLRSGDAAQETHAAESFFFFLLLLRSREELLLAGRLPDVDFDEVTNADS